MARIRSIKPEFFTSLTVAELDVHTRLTFIGLWTHVDDEGRCVDDPRLIKAAVWPLDDRVSADVEQDLKRLTEASLILRYKVGERSYICVRGWDEHQRINRPTKSKIPPPSERTDPPPSGNRASSRPAETPREEPDGKSPASDSVRTHAHLTEGSLPERNREQGTGNRENPPALASLDAEPTAAEPITGEVARPALGELFVVTGAEVAVAEPSNAGQLNRQWIDFCTANGVKLTNNAIKRYGRHIKAGLDQGFAVDHIKRALAGMLADRVVSRPALLDNYLIRVQQGPELPPERLTRHQADAERRAPEGVTPAARLYDTLTRPA